MFILLLCSIVIVFLIIKFIFNDLILWKEFFIGSAVVIVILSVGYGIITFKDIFDRELVTGKVVDKRSVRVDCQHSYTCNCRSVYDYYSKSSKIECDTCYEHDYDVAWVVRTTVGNIHIDRVDRQGLREPQRFTDVKINEPATLTHLYKNYVKAASDSLFHKVPKEFIPLAYPNVYDYYRIFRFVIDNNVSLNSEEMSTVKMINDSLNQTLKDLALQKQVNVIVVLTKNESEVFAENLRASWQGGKKNDIVIVISYNSFNDLKWVSVFGWSKNDIVNVKTRDAIRMHNAIDDQLTMIIADNIKQYWERKPMKEYEYLLDGMTLTDSQLTILAIIGIVLMVALTVFFIKNS